MRARPIEAGVVSDFIPRFHHLEFSFEGFVEDGREQGVQLGGGLGLQALQRVHLRLQRVQLGPDPALLGERRDWDFYFRKF